MSNVVKLSLGIFNRIIPAESYLREVSWDKMHLEERFRVKGGFITEDDYAEYIADLLTEDVMMKDELILIASARAEGLYAQQLIDNKAFKFSENRVNRDLTRLQDLGLIDVKKKVGRVKVYEVTELGRVSLKKLKDKKHR